MHADHAVSYHAVDALTGGCDSLTAPVPKSMDCAAAAWARRCPEPSLGALGQRNLIWQVAPRASCFCTQAYLCCCYQHACMK